MFFVYCFCFFFFFFKQKTAYEMRISDWSSDVCSSDLYGNGSCDQFLRRISVKRQSCIQQRARAVAGKGAHEHRLDSRPAKDFQRMIERSNEIGSRVDKRPVKVKYYCINFRSEEHTSELQSLMRISYAVFCLKTKNKTH